MIELTDNVTSGKGQFLFEVITINYFEKNRRLFLSNSSGLGTVVLPGCRTGLVLGMVTMFHV